MGFPILVRWHLYIESEPSCLFGYALLFYIAWAVIVCLNYNDEPCFPGIYVHLSIGVAKVKWICVMLFVWVYKCMFQLVSQIEWCNIHWLKVMISCVQVPIYNNHIIIWIVVHEPRLYVNQTIKFTRKRNNKIRDIEPECICLLSPWLKPWHYLCVAHLQWRNKV